MSTSYPAYTRVPTVAHYDSNVRVKAGVVVVVPEEFYEPLLKAEVIKPANDDTIWPDDTKPVVQLPAGVVQDFIPSGFDRELKEEVFPALPTPKAEEPVKKQPTKKAVEKKTEAEAPAPVEETAPATEAVEPTPAPAVEATPAEVPAASE